MSKDEIIAAFDPNAAASPDAGLFGLPFTASDADIIIVPVAWETTVSFGSGTAEGPAAVAQASSQVDLHHHDYPEAWKHGFFIDTFPADMEALARQTREQAASIIERIEQQGPLLPGSDLDRAVREVNDACARMNAWVYQRCSYWKQQGKKVGLLGGDHSIPFGYLQLHAEQYADFGVLHVDAHHDLRVAYEGFTWSHASIFYNALETLPSLSKVVQVGIRDYCRQEHEYAAAHANRIHVHYERDMRDRLYRGETWQNLCREIIAGLPSHVHISIDIDGLDPVLCPHTGTPVPGGLGYEELMFLLNELKGSGRCLIGFDLCEIAPGSDGWDANAGARVLFHLCALAAMQ
jgi:agmatinase